MAAALAKDLRFHANSVEVEVLSTFGEKTSKRLGRGLAVDCPMRSGEHGGPTRWVGMPALICCTFGGMGMRG